MRIRRSRPERDYAKIPNAALQDERLSYRARGVLGELLSRLDDWDTNADAMAVNSTRRMRWAQEGRKPIRAAYAELEAAGYLTRDDSLAFAPVMGRLKIARRRPGRPRTRPGRVLGDKAYSSTAIRVHLRRRGIKATIPEPADQIRSRLRRGRRGGRPPAFDPAAYKQRNTVERAFCQLRQHRAVATRYDKRDFVWRGTVDVASIRIWLRHPDP